MGKQYDHLSSEERAVLQIEIGNGASIRSIARRLSRSASTLARELSRQEGPEYVATRAAQRYRQRRKNSVRGRKIIEGSALFQSIRDDLVLGSLKYQVQHPHMRVLPCRSIPEPIAI